MPRRTIRPLLAAIAIAAAALGVTGTATAAPTGPCKDVPYVGVCEPLGEQPRHPSQQSMAEPVIPGGNDTIQPVN
jgi:hypothetical protein